MKKCINCGRTHKGSHRAYCPDCISVGNIPVHTGFAWHTMVIRKDREIRNLKSAIRSLKKI